MRKTPRTRVATALLCGAMLIAAPSLAQQMGDDGPEPIDDAEVFQPDQSQPPVIVTQDIEAVRSDGVTLRGLDKVTGRTVEIPLDVGDSHRYGRLEVRLGECRYPAGNPASDAYAQLVITDLVHRKTLFSGWMVASSPAISALDDARYDIWVISCKS